MRVLLVALVAGAVFAVPATAYAQFCTRNAKPDGQVAEGEYAIVSFAPKPNNPSQEISTVHYGPGSTIPGAIGGASFLSGVIINPRACAVAAAPSTPLAPANDPAKQFAMVTNCGHGGRSPLSVKGPAVITSITISTNAAHVLIEQGGKAFTLQQPLTGDLRLASDTTLTVRCNSSSDAAVIAVTGYRL